MSVPYLHKPQSMVKAQRSLNRKLNWNPKFVGIDGEGFTDEAGVHHYFLLACSDGSFVTNPLGLSSAECLRFLFDVKSRNPHHVLVCYGASYDVNMMLHDLPQETVQEIWENKWAKLPLHSYRCRYVHRKSFQVSRWVNDKRESFIMYDVIGFFQQPFVDAIKEWLGEDYVDLPTIQAGKDRRSQFAVSEVDAILLYCRAELRALCLLMDSVADSLRRAGIRIGLWYGPGAIASRLLRDNHVQEQRSDTYHNRPDVYLAARHGFAGGRIELLRYGYTRGPIYHYDVNSAYPAAISDLPSLRGVEWHHVAEPDIRLLSSFSLVHIKWRADSFAPFYPYFYRNPHGLIYYPRSGEGWYWAVEVQAAEPYFAGKVKCVEAYVPGGLSSYTPFGWVRALYDHRAQLKAAGDPAHRTIKLGLNSLYGKLIQHVGGDEEHSLLPAYHQLEWAGYITAATRAKLYATAMQAPEDIIAFQTDGIFSTKELDVSTGKGLGEWTQEETCTEGLFVQSGIYWTVAQESGITQHYRGFDRGSLSMMEVKASMERGEPMVTAPSTRFVTMGSALAGQWQEWCNWRTIQRELQLTPEGTKREGLPRTSGIGLHGTRAAENFLRVGISEPYCLPWDNWEKRGEDIIDGVPGVLYYGEHEDTEA